MEEAIRYGVMVAFTKATGPMVKLKDEVDSYMQMATSIMAIGRTISRMGTELILRAMVLFIRVSGLTIKNMGKV